MQQILDQFAIGVGQGITSLLTYLFNGYYIIVSSALSNLWAIAMSGAGLVVLNIMRKHAQN